MTPGKDVENDAGSSTSEDSTTKLPNGGYGWIILGAAVAVHAIAWGINITFGVYASFFIENNSFSGGTPLRYSFVGGLSVGVALAAAPLAKILIKQFGFRVPIFLGTVFITLGQCLAGISTSFGAYLVCQGIVFGLGLGIIFATSQPLLAQWFDTKLSLVSGLSMGGAGAGGLILSNTTRVLIEKLSVREALYINGGISAAVMLPCVFLVRKGPADVGMHSPSLQLRWLYHPGFVWVWLWGSLAVMGYFIAMYSVASYATDGLGLSQTQAAAVQSFLSAGLMIGRPLTGFALDQGGRVNIALLANVIAGITCWALWLPARSFPVLAVFAFLHGCAAGSVWSAALPVTAQVVGPSQLGPALAMFWLVAAAPAAVSSALATVLLDYSRHVLGKHGAEAYAIPIIFCGCLYFLSGLSLYGAKVHCQKSFAIWRKV